MYEPFIGSRETGSYISLPTVITKKEEEDLNPSHDSLHYFQRLQTRIVPRC